MDALVGRTLSHFRITARVGAGGMGEVYQARDERLGRDVALKLLPVDLAMDLTSRARFLREARAASSLSHPHICTIYDVGEHEERLFIAMELLHGHTLHERIAAGPIDVHRLLEWGSQIADALESAHQRGVIHRDIKPSNLFVTTRGEIKVLDFGLAKVTSSGKQTAAVDDVTGTARPAEAQLTSPGLAIGTIAYMSPEQARGEDLDARTDIFSFGAVLHEMASGRPAFAGPTTATIFDAILNRDPPPVRILRPSLPEGLEGIVGKALEKDRALRYQSATELRSDILRLRRDLTSGRAAASPVVKRSFRTALRWAASAAVIALAAAGALWIRSQGTRRAPSNLPLRVVPLTSLPGFEMHPTFSPHGDMVAFAWAGERGENMDIYVKQVGPATPIRLTSHQAEDLAPRWSPDGRYIAFIRVEGSRGAVYLVPALGGPERKLCEIEPPYYDHTSLDWSPDGKYLVVPDRKSAKEPFSLWLVSVDSGEGRRLTLSAKGTLGDFDPVFSPDGHRVAYAGVGSPNDALEIVPATGGRPRSLGEQIGLAGITWSADGRDLIFACTHAGRRGIWRVPASGGAPKLLDVGADQAVAYPTVSREGNRLAYPVYSSSTSLDLWSAAVSEIASKGRPEVRLIASSHIEFGPKYSPDGLRIAFVSNRSGHNEVWTADSRGKDQAQLTSFDGPWTGDLAWSPNSQLIAFATEAGGSRDIWILRAGGGAPRRLTAEPSNDGSPVWSADGRWVYFHSDRGGGFHVWKIPPSGGRAVQVTRDAGGEPMIPPQGDPIYYWNDPTEPTALWAVPSEGGPPALVFKLPEPDQTMESWAVAPRGIYFTSAGSIHAYPTLWFHDFAGGRTSQIAVVEKSWGRGGFTVSPDGSRFVFGRLPEEEADIFLVENFR